MAKESTNPFKAAEERKRKKQEEERKRKQELAAQQGTETPMTEQEPPKQEEPQVQEVAQEPVQKESFPVQEDAKQQTPAATVLTEKEEISTVEQPKETVTTPKQVPAEPAAPEEPEKLDISAELRRIYASNEHLRFDSEKKTYRYNALIKPSLAKKMDRDMRNKNLKSKNDLINFLLEMYYGEN